MYVRRLLLAGMAACLLAAGCSGNKPNPVEGKIYLEGQPLAGATIMFHPEKGGAPASGLSGDGGVFTLTTLSSGDGAPPGLYKVTVTKAAGGGSGRPLDPKKPEDMAEMVKRMSRPTAPDPTKEKSDIHANYQDVSKTPIKVEILKGGKKDVEIKLYKDGRG